MNHRLSTLFARKAYAADVTEIIDLDMSDPISQLVIEITPNITNDQAITAHAIRCLTKIEIVDGSDVLFSLSGAEALAVDWYHNHVLRSPWNIYMGWGETQTFVGINFGRYLWDKELAFDPTNFKNPQLKISLDIDAGGAVPSLNRLGVWAAMFDQQTITPVGFLMHKEIKNYAMAVSSHEYTDLPTDYPYRKFFVRCQTYGTEPGQKINKIKLSEDQDKRIIFDHIPEEILRSICYTSPPIEEHIIARVSTVARNFFCTPTTRVNAVASPRETAIVGGVIACADGDGGRIPMICATAEQYATFFVRGWLPHGTYEIPFGDQMDMDEWFDVTKVGSLKADIDSTSAGLTTDSVQIFLQQLRKY